MQRGVSNNDIPLNIQEGLDLITLSNEEFKSFTKTRMKGFIEDFQQNYDIIVMLNEDLGKQKSLLLMSIATVNLVVVDARLTPAGRIIELDLLKEEFDLPSVHFVLITTKVNHVHCQTAVMTCVR